MLVRREQDFDRSAVAAVHQAAFGDHAGTVVPLVEALRESLNEETGLSLVAVDGERVVGHILFTRNLLDAPRRLVDVQVLSPLAVLPQWQHQGVGTALVRSGIEKLVDWGVPLIFLEGSPSYYSRHGFSPGGKHAFRRPSLRIPDAAFQVRFLPAYESWMTGTLVYRRTFWDHDAVGLRDDPSAVRG